MKGMYRLIMGGEWSEMHYASSWAKKEAARVDRQRAKMEKMVKHLLTSLRRQKITPRVAQYTVLSPDIHETWDREIGGWKSPEKFSYTVSMLKVISW